MEAIEDNMMDFGEEMAELKFQSFFDESRA
jgi:hypothetical protein